MKRPSSQKEPGGDGLSAERFEAMSPIELVHNLERMLDTMTEESYDPNAIDACLDALNRKAPMPEAPNAREAFQTFQEKLQSASPDPDPKAAPVNTAKRHPYQRAIVAIAAAIVLVFAIMLGAQAAGLDVFGNLARWTDEVFFFIPSHRENPHTSEFSAAFQEALEGQELPKELAPTWFPDGFTAGDPEVWDDDVSKTVELAFVNPEGKGFFVSVDYYKEAGSIGTLPFEKDATDVEPYTSNGRTFYIMSNVNTNTAAWSDENLVTTIRGKLSVEEIKTIIDSIGGS